jgi:DNA-binding MarR family transcriptional regulator
MHLDLDTTTPPNTQPHALATELSDLLPAMFMLLRPGGRDRPHEPPPPEVRGQMRMMKILHHAGPMTMNDLAERMNVAPPTVTGIVKRGVAQGTVVRIPDPEDGRMVRVELTDTGREQMDAHRTAHVAMLERLVEALNAEDQRALQGAIPALQRLLTVARATTATETPSSFTRET